jgi:8-oxo-dGTP pyrophosphatase MutT (NUDIX family)
LAWRRQSTDGVDIELVRKEEVEMTETKLNLRVAAIFQQRARVLLHRSVLDDFWSLPGGRIQLMEDSQTAILREMKEELGIEVKVERLMWVVENFFVYDDTPFHEIAFYYLLHFPAESVYLQQESFPGVERDFNQAGVDLQLEFRWFHLNELSDLELYPSFLRTDLTALPDRPTHIIHTDPRRLLK